MAFNNVYKLLKSAVPCLWIMVVPLVSRAATLTINDVTEGQVTVAWSAFNGPGLGFCVTGSTISYGDGATSPLSGFVCGAGGTATFRELDNQPNGWDGYFYVAAPFSDAEYHVQFHEGDGTLSDVVRLGFSDPLEGSGNHCTVGPCEVHFFGSFMSDPDGAVPFRPFGTVQGDHIIDFDEAAGTFTFTGFPNFTANVTSDSETAVAEPGSLLLLGSGLCGIAAAVSRKVLRS